MSLAKIVKELWAGLETITTRLRFEYEVSPQAHVFEHLVPNGGVGSGKLWNH